MLKVVRVVNGLAAKVLAIGSLGPAFIFGDRAGRKVPAYPEVGLEVFRIALLGVAPAAFVWRVRRGRIIRVLGEALAEAVAAARDLVGLVTRANTQSQNSAALSRGMEGADPKGNEADTPPRWVGTDVLTGLPTAPRSTGRRRSHGAS